MEIAKLRAGFMRDIADDEFAKAGFKDARLGCPASQTRTTILRWLNNSSCFIGSYYEEPPTGEIFVDVDKTPFHRLYYVYLGPKRCPLLALRMQQRIKGEKRAWRIDDPYECLPNAFYTKEAHERDEVTIYALNDEEDTVEATTSIKEADFLAAFPEAQTWVKR